MVGCLALPSGAHTLSLVPKRRCLLPPNCRWTSTPPRPLLPLPRYVGEGRGWHGVRESEGESVQPRAPPSLTRLCAPPPACLDKIWYPRHPTAAGDAAFERRPPPLLPRGPEGGRDPPLPR